MPVRKLKPIEERGPYAAMVLAAFDEMDAEPEETGELDDDAGDDCGRWSNGRLMNSCSKAGSEECDFECPHR